jgi:hypothetical protein
MARNFGLRQGPDSEAGLVRSGRHVRVGWGAVCDHGSGGLLPRGVRRPLAAAAAVEISAAAAAAVAAALCRVGVNRLPSCAVCYVVVVFAISRCACRRVGEACVWRRWAVGYSARS